MTAEAIARALGGRRSGKGWVARCPAHDDKSPSLSLTDSGDRVLVFCHTGCRQADVIAALRARGLWPERERGEWTAAERSDFARRRQVAEDLAGWRQAAIGALVGMRNRCWDLSRQIEAWVSRAVRRHDADEALTGAAIHAMCRYERMGDDFETARERMENLPPAEVAAIRERELNRSNAA